MTNQQPAELSQPSVGPLHNPATLVSSELASVLVPPMLVVLPIGHDQFDTAAAQALAQRIGIVAAIGNHPFWFLSRAAFGLRNPDLGERGFRKRNFTGRGTFQPNSQRKTFTVDGPALASAHKKLSATYQVPFMKHAPIGPTMAVADVKPDGTVHIHTHNQNPQELRGEIAMMLRTTPDHVIVHAYPGPGHYGRSNGGNAGAEDEAVLLSQALGKPVRVQWMRADDMQWSTQSAAAFSDVQIAIDERGKIAAYQSDHFMPAMQDDRPIGAVLAGLPTMPAPDVHSDFITATTNTVADPWVYAPVANVLERAMAHFRWDRKRRLWPSVFATTVCGPRCSTSKTFPANWR
jgi:CO/xanthine dehydrogenase Mo-binding subunit